MRHQIAALLACVCLAGCTSSGLDDMDVRPSQEITNSVTRTAASTAPEQDTAIDLADVAPRPNAAMALEPVAEPAALLAAPKPAFRPQMLQPEPQRVATAAMVRPLTPKGLQVFQRKFRDAKPINFGRISPRSHAVHGVDVSRWQGDIDWPKLRMQGANFAYIKATDGGDHLDPMFRHNWKASDDAGLKRGAYHFFYWCRDAGSQARWFIRNVPRVAGALPPVIDVEWNGESSCKHRPSPAKVREKMQVFMDALEAYYGKRPVIYTAPDFYRDNLRGAFPNHHFWLRAVAQHPSKVYPDRKWVFWQYSGSGLSHGVSGRIDLNAFQGSVDDWRDWLGENAG